MSETVRAKFRCNSVESYSNGPTTYTTYAPDGTTTERAVHPRTFRFYPQYDPDVPEDQRYCHATPSGELTIKVDNPAVAFEVGRQYYLDFTPAGEA